MRRHIFMHLASASFVLATATGMAQGAIAAPIDLFATPTESQRADIASKPAGKTEDRTAIAAVNAAAIADDNAGELRIKLFPGVSRTFSREAVDKTKDGGRTWVGRGQGDERATLAFRPDGALTGQVVIGGSVYSIAPAKAGVARIARLAPGGFPKEGPLTPAPDAPARGQKDKSPEAGKAPKDAVVTVLFAYTKLSRQTSPDIAGEIDLAVSLADQAYKEAGVRIKLAGTIEVPKFDESTSTFEGMLTAVTKGKGNFSRVAEMRETTKADLVVFIQESVTTYCGIGWYVPNPTIYTAHRGYSVVLRECIQNQTVAHEMGHNMGLNHDRYVLPPASPEDYNFGYAMPGKQVRDIMAYDDACNAKGKSCARLNAFSSPIHIVRKKQFGVSAGNPDAADAVRRLSETGHCIAEYR